MQKASVIFLFAIFAASLKAASQVRLSTPADSSKQRIALKVVPQNFYKNSLPFSCKTEYQLQKLTSLPVYFRIGSKDYVDWLEQKPNAAKYLQ